MIMTFVYLIQHGKSLPKEVDPERKLSDEGIAETARIAKFLKSAGVKIDRIIHSDKLRAKMTAEIIAKELGISNISEEPGLAPLDDPTPWANKLNEVEDNVMIVGHLPHLSKLTSMLLNIPTEVVSFRYSGVLCLEKLESGVWRIKWYVTPDIIK